MAKRYLGLQKDLYVCFVDFHTASDHIQPKEMLEILGKIGLVGRDLAIIRNPY